MLKWIIRNNRDNSLWMFPFFISIWTKEDPFKMNWFTRCFIGNDFVIVLEVKGYSTKYMLFYIQHYITTIVYFSLDLNVSVATNLIQDTTTKLITTKLIIANVIQDVQEMCLKYVVVGWGFQSTEKTKVCYQTLKENSSQLNNCYNSIHFNFLFVNN